MDISINNIDLNTSQAGLLMLERSNNQEKSAEIEDFTDLTKDLQDYIQKALGLEQQQIEMAQKAVQIMNTEDYDNPKNIESAAENLLKLGI